MSGFWISALAAFLGVSAPVVTLQAALVVRTVWVLVPDPPPLVGQTRMEGSIARVPVPGPVIEEAVPAPGRLDQASPSGTETATAPATSALPCAGWQMPAGVRSTIALELGRRFAYQGDRADPDLRVVASVSLGTDGHLAGRPRVIDTAGGSVATRKALFRAALRALVRAEAAGVFAKLPPNRYQCWRKIEIVFGIDTVRFEQ